MEDFDDTVKEIAAAASPEALEAIRVKVLGRRGSLTLAMRELGGLDPEERRHAGAALNVAKDRVTAALAEATARLGRSALEQRLAGERADVTLPVSIAATGRVHPISQTIDEIVAIFGETGFAFAEGPHIEEDFYNFTALNIPPLQRCRSGRCRRKSRRSGSSSRGGPSAATTTRRTPRCFIRSRGWSSTGRPIWVI